MTLRYLSVCSGIESASVAWEPLGFAPVAFAEIAAFPSRVLAARWPNVPNLGDFTAIDVEKLGPVDVLVGGTPCQAFSVAGRRLSLADARGNLSLAFGVLAHELARCNGLRWALWENVPGVLSRRDNAFGCILGVLVGADAALPLPRGAERWPDEGMAEGPRARVAWRVLDAQHFGLAQRRRRVFVVVGVGDGADPAAVLFEPRGLRGDPAPRGATRAHVAGALAPGSGGGCGPDDNDAQAGHLIAVAFGGNDTRGPIDVAAALAHGGRLDFESETFVASRAGTLVAGGNSTGGARYPGTSAETTSYLVASTLRARAGAKGVDSDCTDTLIAFQQGGSNVGVCTDGVAGTLTAGNGNESGGIPCVAFDCKAGGDTGFSIGELPGSLRGAGHGGGHAAIAFQDRFRGDDGRGYDRAPPLSHEIVGALETVKPWCVSTDVGSPWAVRRLTPTECHRLQGFADDHCAIPGAKDGPIYMALGNAKAVPVVRWIGARLAAADAICPGTSRPPSPQPRTAERIAAQDRPAPGA